MSVPSRTTSLRTLPVAAALLVAASIASGCEEEKHSYVPNVDTRVTPTMVTYDVNTVISDSGYTRYRIVTPVWNMYEDTLEPHWTFPMGLTLQQYDQAMRPDANVRCDSAIYFTNTRLWRLDGNVVMVNTQRDSFLTQQLFWDQRHQRVYSDSFIHIVRNKYTIEGYGFTSNQQMTAYNIQHPTAIIPADQARNSGTQAGARNADTAMTTPAFDPRSERPMAPQPASQRANNVLLNPLNPGQ